MKMRSEIAQMNDVLTSMNVDKRGSEFEINGHLITVVKMSPTKFIAKIDGEGAQQYETKTEAVYHSLNFALELTPAKEVGPELPKDFIEFTPESEIKVVVEKLTFEKLGWFQDEDSARYQYKINDSLSIRFFKKLKEKAWVIQFVDGAEAVIEEMSKSIAPATTQWIAREVCAKLVADLRTQITAQVA